MFLKNISLCFCRCITVFVNKVEYFEKYKSYKHQKSLLLNELNVLSSNTLFCLYVGSMVKTVLVLKSTVTVKAPSSEPACRSDLAFDRPERTFQSKGEACAHTCPLRFGVSQQPELAWKVEAPCSP